MNVIEVTYKSAMSEICIIQQLHKMIYLVICLKIFYTDAHLSFKAKGTILLCSQTMFFPTGNWQEIKGAFFLSLLF